MIETILLALILFYVMNPPRPAPAPEPPMSREDREWNQRELKRQQEAQWQKEEQGRIAAATPDIAPKTLLAWTGIIIVIGIAIALFGGAA
ncbi:MAG TPA: hypothetical protein VGR63_08800 [Casimicrobiaceae bacterium]|jgi:hypothetical protein|nr:hypothetical protein [Casimicrobiaceae bacterium]